MERERERESVDYDSQNLTDSDRLWKAWLVGKDHLHPETVEEILTQWKEGRCSLVVENISTLEASPTYRVLTGLLVGLELEIEFEAEAAEPMTHSYPGSPASLQILSAKLGETSFPQRLFDELMSEYADELEEACWDRLFEEEEKEER